MCGHDDTELSELVLTEEAAGKPDNMHDTTLFNSMLAFKDTVNIYEMTKCLT